MPKSANQKRKLILLQNYLYRQTDEEHPANARILMEELARSGITVERKTISSDIQTLTDAGMDIHCRRGQGGGWYVGARPFELAELKLLVDAVQSSRFITRRKSEALIQKLSALVSVPQEKALRRQVHVSERVKTVNERVYYNIDALHDAIATKRGVHFRYFEYNVKKERVYRRGGTRYTVTPCALVWDNENYYLVGYDHDKGDTRTYRVDKMEALGPDETIPYPDTCRDFDLTQHSQTHFGMFHGEEAQIRLRCENAMVGVILDRFGQEAMLIPDGERHFTVTVPVAVSPQFFGWLFGLGPAVTILSPERARLAYQAQLQAVAHAAEQVHSFA
ncbi:MAG: transcriptional regulator [Oscillospiraceae bacterium]|nr:transcriptional regulator [Oscillospiraceae bacterium]